MNFNLKYPFVTILGCALNLPALLAHPLVELDDMMPVIPSGKIDVQHNAKLLFRPLSSGSESVRYNWGRADYYSKANEADDWTYSNSSVNEFNDKGLITKAWRESSSESKDNNYYLYSYDDQNREVKSEAYWIDNGTLALQAYQTREYLKDFPDIESKITSYVRQGYWDYDTEEWKYQWKLSAAQKRDYTISKKVANHYEKHVDYTYDIEAGKWIASGYKYDYVVNPKGLITETLVYQANDEDEANWPLILHVKNLINDNGVVFRSERINYRGSKPFIERWSSIKWDRHDGEMPISGYAVSGASRIKSAKIEYVLANDPTVEYAPARSFEAEYANDVSYHYVVSDNEGNKLIDNSYSRDAEHSLAELWQGSSYQMQYYDYDEHNWVVYDHYVRRQYYEDDNVITLTDRHRYTNNEYYLDTDELSVQEHYEYDALADTEPYGRFRTVYSNYQAFSTGIERVEKMDDEAAPVYYNLQGIQIKHPQPGQLLIRRTGVRSEKIVY